MKEEELLRCQIQEWYPNFKPYSIKTLIHPLPDPFLRYLLQDDGPFLLPSSSSGRDPLPRTTASTVPDEDASLFPTTDSDNDGSDEDPPPEPPSFPDLESQVTDSIAILGGAAFPKLNWSSPKDAASMGVAGSLKCTSFAEVALLLKSSDCITHDLCHALDSCSDRIDRPSSSSSSTDTKFYLALRKWYDSLRPEMEFRCFVRQRRLVGISQREVTTFYPVLIEKRSSIELLIEEFIEDIVLPKFKSEDYTVDVYVTRDRRVKVLDFNPWGAYTLPLLFEWEELEESGDGEHEMEFRIVESQRGVRPGLKTSVPFDYLDTGEGSGWDQFLRRADEELQTQVQSLDTGA